MMSENSTQLSTSTDDMLAVTSSLDKSDGGTPSNTPTTIPLNSSSEWNTTGISGNCRYLLSFASLVSIKSVCQLEILSILQLCK